MKVVPIGFFGSADELIAQVELAGSRTPSHTGHRACPAQNKIFQMLSHRTAVAQVMIAAEQMGEELLALGSPHQPDLQRLQRGQRSFHGGGVIGLDLRYAPMRDGVISPTFATRMKKPRFWKI